MTLAGTTVFSVALVSQNAILGYLQSVLACILDCLRKFRGPREKVPPNWHRGAVPGNSDGARCRMAMRPSLRLTLPFAWVAPRRIGPPVLRFSHPCFHGLQP